MSTNDEALKKLAEKKKIKKIKKITGLPEKEIRDLLKKDPGIFDTNQTKSSSLPQGPRQALDLDTPHRTQNPRNSHTYGRYLPEKIETTVQDMVRYQTQGKINESNPTVLSKKGQVVTRLSDWTPDLSTGSLSEFGQQHPWMRRMKVGGGIGAAFALGVNMFDSENDSIVGGAMDMAFGFGMGALANTGFDAFADNTITGRKISNFIADEIPSAKDNGIVWSPERERISAGDLSNEIDTKHTRELMTRYGNPQTASDYEKKKITKHEHVVREIDKEKIAKKAASWNRTGKIGFFASVGLIGATSLLDVSHELHEETTEAKMINTQEKNLKRQEIAEQRALRRNDYGYASSYVDFGEIATELFNERIGHYKMGNSKFE